MLREYTCKEDTNCAIFKKRSECIKVCCPHEPLFLEYLSAKLTDTPLGVARLRKYRLLPRDCGYVKIEDANLNEFPWMALLGYKTKKGLRFNCGATILNKNYVLTAAHCLRHGTLLTVRVGEQNLSTERDCETDNDNKTRCNPPVQDLSILEIIPHSQLNQPYRFNNDVGLIRVSTIDLSKASAKPICMPVSSEIDLSYTHVVVAGWGVTQHGSTGRDVLQKAEVPVVSMTSCQAKYDTFNVTLNDGQICAGGGGKDTCHGDSGGPLKSPLYTNGEVRFVQHGIVSFGYNNCGKMGIPGVYTKVAFYMDWILDHIKP